MAVKQTAGRKELGEFAPKFAELNDDVLFGEVWNREDKLSLRDRSLVTVTSLMSQSIPLFVTIWKVLRKTESQKKKSRRF